MTALRLTGPLPGRKPCAKNRTILAEPVSRLVDRSRRLLAQPLDAFARLASKDLVIDRSVDLAKRPDGLTRGGGHNNQGIFRCRKMRNRRTPLILKTLRYPARCVAEARAVAVAATWKAGPRFHGFYTPYQEVRGIVLEEVRDGLPTRPSWPNVNLTGPEFELDRARRDTLRDQFNRHTLDGVARTRAMVHALQAVCGECFDALVRPDGSYRLVDLESFEFFRDHDDATQFGTQMLDRYLFYVWHYAWVSPTIMTDAELARVSVYGMNRPQSPRADQYFVSDNTSFRQYDTLITEATAFITANRQDVPA